MFNKKGKKIWKLVEQHINYTYECYECFERFIGDFMIGHDSNETFADFKKIDDLEGQADRTRKALVSAFLGGSLLPSTRKEILKIVGMVDEIANSCQDISRQLIYESVKIPDMLKSGMMDITRITKTQINVLAKVLDILFADYEILIKDSSMLDEIGMLEGKIDDIELELIKNLFASDLPLAEKNHAKHFLRELADISDHIEDIADEIQIIVVFRKV